MDTHREPNLEILTAAQPDLIVNGQRFTQHRDAIVKLNPGANIVSMFRGDDLRSNLPWVVLLGVGIVTVCDLIGRTIIAPFEIPVSVILGIVGAVVFVPLIVRQRRG
ncbi:iron chelate uptake ABC transporter family permease subunit [Corynebacterium glutamicum]|uniref:iron chelate uptake ABC transporter family permease subunit n=1 Tax=Corynebacterium glutamicum TaxID=1718 RepID=UPI002E28A264|nr:iron chelate uptake ABC transporter family permease subunit [Corynebacterium glutamicum]